LTTVDKRNLIRFGRLLG